MEDLWISGFFSNPTCDISQVREFDKQHWETASSTKSPVDARSYLSARTL